MKLSETKKAYLFDLFDTLTDFESEWSSIPSASSMLGVDSKRWNEQLLLYSADRLTGKLRDSFRIIRDMAHNIDPSIPDEVIQEVVTRRTNRYMDALLNIPVENIETIRTLHRQGKKIALLSNADVMECLGWDQSPLKSFFDLAAFSCETGFVKPDPQAYLYCMQKLGVQPEDCVFVGDGGSNELAGAQNLGITTVFISGKMRLKQQNLVIPRIRQSDFHVESIPELLVI